jgi:iron(III) transport system ATP-binding protein
MNVLHGEVCDGEIIQVGSATLNASGTLNGYKSGDQVTVCMRPEDVVLADRAEDGGDNTYAGRIQELEFLGSIYRALVEVTEGDGFLVAVSLPIRFVRERDIGIDSALSIALPKERLRIFAKGTSADPH